MKKTYSIRYALLTVLALSTMLLTGTACSDDDDDSVSTTNWDISGNALVNIKPERYKLLRNPMTGWVIYAGLGDGMIDDFWEQYDNFESSEGNVKVSDYANTLYVRGAWSDFNPREGVYVWQDDCDTITARRFRMLVNGARERGLKIAFTFVVDSRDKHYNFTPAYVRAAGCKGYETTTGSARVWSPYPDDPVFQEKYTKFLTDFAAKYNDPSITQFVSGFGLGMWGETHTLIYSTGDESPKEQVFEWITDLMPKLFTKVPIVINYHRCLLSTKTFSGASTSEAADLIGRAVKKGFSLRHDAFGMKSYYTTWERSIAAKYKYICPIIEEGGWVDSSHGSSIKGDGYANYAEVRKGEFDEGKGACVNMMDLRYNSNVKSGEAHSWFNSAFDLVKEFVAEGGYRLYPDRISVPLTARAGGQVTFVHRWSNLGWGYCPTNLPQWNQKYKVCFALLDKSTLKPVFKHVVTEPCLNEWVKGSPKTYTSTFTLDDVQPGDYVWAVGLVDTTDDNEIGLQVSARSEYLTDDGWVKLSEVTVK